MQKNFRAVKEAPSRCAKDHATAMYTLESESLKSKPASVVRTGIDVSRRHVDFRGL